MLSRSRLVFLSFSLVVVLLIVGGTLLAAGAREGDDGSDSLYKYLGMFTEILSLVDKAYVDETDPVGLLDGAIEGAGDALDPFSLYIPPDRLDAYKAQGETSRGRSGLLVLKERGTTYVLAVDTGSPADQAGFQPTDILAMIDGRSTREMPLWEIRQLLGGEVGTELQIQRIRINEKTTVEMKLADFASPGVQLEVKDGLAVLRIKSFDAETPKNIEVSLKTLLAEGETSSAGIEDRSRLLLDLRGMAGGDPKIAYRVASFFVRGDLGILSARGEAVESFESAFPAHWQGQILILIDGSTQGPAEILATILQQSAEAILAGTTSFGHSGRSKWVELSNGGGLQITDAFYTGPDEKPLNESLVPDIRLLERLLDPSESEDADVVLDRALEILRKAEPEAEQKEVA